MQVEIDDTFVVNKLVIELLNVESRLSTILVDGSWTVLIVGG